VRLTVLIIFFKLNNYYLKINCIGNKVLIFFLFLLIIFYILSTLYLTYLIIKRKFKNNKIKYISLIQDWEFILFKNKIFKLYYSTVIILFIFIFKTYGFIYLLEFNLKFIFILTLILILCSILLSNYFNLFLFKIYLEIKYYIQVLSEINFKFKPNMEIINKFKPIVFYPSRSFTTFSKNNNINDFENNPLDQDNISNNPDNSLKKQLKEFKKA
jgi:hypothetical protein